MDIITLSGVRKELLLYLDGGPRSLSDIREYLDITSPEVSPRIKELIEHNLVQSEGKKYQLTPMGKTILKNFHPFLDTINVFEQYPDFWDEHDLTSIPEEFLVRIGEIKNYVIIEDDINDINRTNNEFSNLVKTSKYIFGTSCAFDSSFPETCLTAARNDIPISIILSRNVYDIIIKNYEKQIKEFLKSRKSELYIIDDNIKTSHVVTDTCLLLCLSFKNNKFDMHSNLVSMDTSSIHWGSDLYEFYRKNSKKLTPF